MNVIGISLENFRSYEKKSLAFDEGINVIYGKNGCGKTNLLEAIYVCGVGKSPRATRDKELLRYDSDHAEICLDFEKSFRLRKIKVCFDQNGKKRIFLDGLPIARVGELLGELSVVYFSPDELKLIKETPEDRRRFMDISLCQQKKSYFFSLQRYNQVLKQRNALLKQPQSFETLDKSLEIWDVQLVNEGAKIVADRRAFLRRLSLPAATAHATLSQGQEELTLDYDGSVSGDTAEEIAAAMAKKIASEREKDIRLQYTNTGPHRDDIYIALNGKDCRKYASQGQQRTAALSLKLAEVEIMKADSGETPILLLDDVLSELDKDRRTLLLEALDGIQAFLTCTEYAETPSVRTTPITPTDE